MKKLKAHWFLIVIMSVSTAFASEADRLNDLGREFHAKGQFDKAIEYYEKALASNLMTFGPDHPNVAREWSNLGEAWRSKGDYDKAIEYYEKVLRSLMKTYGTTHPRVVTTWINLALAWNGNGQYDKAIEVYEKVLGMLINTYGNEHRFVALVWNNMGETWYEKKNFEHAKACFEKSLAIRKIMLGSNHPDTIKSEKWLENADKKMERAKPKDPQIDKIPISLRLPRWMVEWLKTQDNQAEAVERAMIKQYKLKEPN